MCAKPTNKTKGTLRRLAALKYTLLFFWRDHISAKFSRMPSCGHCEDAFPLFEVQCWKGRQKIIFFTHDSGLFETINGHCPNCQPGDFLWDYHLNNKMERFISPKHNDDPAQDWEDSVAACYLMNKEQTLNTLSRIGPTTFDSKDGLKTWPWPLKELSSHANIEMQKAAHSKSLNKPHSPNQSSSSSKVIR